MAGETGSKDKAEKKQCKLNRLTVAGLKQLVAKPEVVEWMDVSAADPRLLHLRCYRNTIPIPVHWSPKRDWLGFDQARSIPDRRDSRPIQSNLLM
jgi:splicing factor 3B subunit 2